MNLRADEFEEKQNKPKRILHESVCLEGKHTAHEN